MSALLDTFGELEVSTPAGTARLSGRGERIILDVATPGVAGALLRTPFTGSRAQRVRSLNRFGRALAHSGLRLTVRLRGREVAELQDDRAGTLLSALLGLGAVRIRPGALVAALLAR